MFYDRFLELCKEKGVKPTNACVEAGLSRGLAAKWKSTGTEKPSADALEKLAAYFHMSIEEILGKPKTPAEADVTFDDFTYAMYGEAKDLSEESKNMLLDMARMLKKRQQEGK